jgi:Pao retrotransposon peptidase
MLSWDDSLPSDIIKTFKSTTKYLSLLSDISLPRWLGAPADGRLCINIFCDASPVAIAAIAYSMSPSRSTCLLIAKSRLVKKNLETMPQLELAAASLGTHLLEFIRVAIGNRILKVCMWSDSSIVLSWIRGCNPLLDAYTKTRVFWLQNIGKDVEWRHIASEENNADIALRGTTPEVLKSDHMWWTGPTWLSGPEDMFPKSKADPIQSVEEAERMVVVSMAKGSESNELLESIVARSTLLCKCIQILVRVQKAVKQFCHEKFVLETGAEDIMQAKKTMILLAQSNMERTSGWLKTINTYIDEDGIVKAKTRLTNSTISHLEIYPVVLPKLSPMLI